MTHFRTLAGSLAIAALAFAACGDDDAEDAGSSGGSSSDPVTIDITDFEYLPATITVAEGTEITFVNNDDAAHTATAREGEFNTESIEGGGAEVTVTASGSGEIAYFCAFHPFMEATIVVE